MMMGSSNENSPEEVAASGLFFLMYASKKDSKLLTSENDKDIIQNDNSNCHSDKERCQRGNVMILRNRLKERRAALNVNQQEMGQLCGVSRQTISLIERGDYSPSVTLALTIAKVCGVTVEEVFYLQEEKHG